jgi:hypothetical protein
MKAGGKQELRGYGVSDVGCEKFELFAAVSNKAPVIKLGRLRE